MHPQLIQSTNARNIPTTQGPDTMSKICLSHLIETLQIIFCYLFSSKILQLTFEITLYENFEYTLYIKIYFIISTNSYLMSSIFLLYAALKMYYIFVKYETYKLKEYIFMRQEANSVL